MVVEITGIGWVTANGVGEGKKGCACTFSDAPLPKLSRADVFSEPYQRFGRLDEFSKLGLAAITFAINDAGLAAWDAKRSIGLISSTSYGCLTTDMTYFRTVLPEGGQMPSPNLFAYTLPNCFLGEAAIRFGLTGTTFIINDSSPSKLAAVTMAMDAMELGEAETMVTGMCDLPLPGGLSLAQKVLPGAVFIVLEKSGKGGGHYGQLQHDSSGQLVLNGSVVESLPQLVEKCLYQKAP